MDIDCDIPDDDMLEVKITRCNAFVGKNFWYIDKLWSFIFKKD